MISVIKINAIFVSDIKNKPLKIDLGFKLYFGKNETFKQNNNFTRILNDNKIRNSVVFNKVLCYVKIWLFKILITMR